jgi:hypothetical protein
MSEKAQFDLAQHVKNLRENMPALLENAELQAKILARKFSALKKEGFTDAHAIELCKTN